MTYRSFLRRFLPRKKAARFSGRKSQRQKRTLHLETLEDRLAPAVLIPVTTHRDLVFDSSRQLLYITTSKGTIERYDVAHQTLLTPWTVGTSLNGADIAPDASALYVGENNLAAGALVHKVNLADGTVKNLTYSGTSGEYGSYDVAISSNGTGFVTTLFNGSGGVFLHQLNLATDTLTTRTDEPTAVFGTIDQNTQVQRGPDRSLLFFTEPDSNGPYFTYNPASNTFPNSGKSNDYQARMLSAVSRDGALIATAPTDSSQGGVTIRDRSLNLVKTLLADDFNGSGLNGGLAFDPTQNILYVADSFHSQIYAYDTTTWNRLFRLNIGENISSEQAFGNGVMTVSPDSHWLFLSTTAGVRMFDLTAPPQVSVSDVTVNDGNGLETTNAQFTVSLSRIEQQPVTVNYATADGTASAVQDYVATSGILLFSPTLSTLPDTNGTPLAMTQTVNVPVINGGGNENETFALNLSNASNAQIAKGQGIGTIQNTVVYTPNAAINSVSVVENSPNTAFAVFTVAFRGAAPGQSYTINYATADVTAKAGVDYTATSGALTFTGPSAQTISVPVTGGVQHAQDVRFYVNISSPSFFIQLSQGTATIVTNTLTAVPSITVNDVTVHKGTGLSSAVFTVSLSSPSALSISVDCATADQSDPPSSVYTPVATTLVFPPGTTSRTVTVTIRGNDFVEQTKTFLLNLKNATNALITRAQATGTILSDINALLSINNVRVAEASSGTTNAVFTVTLSGITSQPVTVNYATADGTATAGTDYQAASGTLTFEAGQTASETISVPVNSDSTPEGDKTFFVNLSGATNATLVNTKGTATILSDIPPVLQAPNVTLQKPASGTQNAVFTVTLPTSSHRTVTVAYTTVDGTAKAGIDYQATGGTLTFAPGQTSLSVSVPVFGNTQSNPDRTFTLQLTDTTAPGGIAMVNDPFPVGPSTGPGAPVFFNNVLYLAGNDGVSGNELWKYDGTTFTQVADINPGASSSNPGQFGWGIYNGALYFSADSGVDGPQLFKYDGTKVSQVADIANFGNGSWPGNFMVFNNKLYFTATNSTDGQQIWSTDGTTTTEVTKTNPGSFNPTLMAVVGNQLVFAATTSAAGRELWKYDGTSASLIADILPGTQGSSPFGTTVYNSALYFRASDSFWTQELYKYDGTAVSFVANINNVSYYGANPTQMIVYNGLLYFAAADESHGRELWQYDGTRVSLVQDAAPGPVDFYGLTLANYLGQLYFSGGDRATGAELWKYDGTYITQAADINPGFFSSNPATGLVFNGSLYLLANDGVHGQKLWTYTEPFIAANTQATGTIHSLGSASTLVVSGFPSPTTAGAAGTVTVTAEDDSGKVIGAYTGTVHFTSSDGQAVLPADYTFTAADAGVHTFSVTLKTAGTQSLTATDTAAATVTGSQTGITVNAAAASSLVVSGFPSPTTAGTSGTVTVTARDPYGNTATGYTGTVHFTSSDAQAALPADYTFVAGNAGVHNFSVTLKTTGSQSLTATDTAASTITGSQTGITVTPAAASSFIVSGFPSPSTAGTAGTVSVTARDPYGNTATGYTGTVHFTSSDGQAVLPADYTFVAGDAGVHNFSVTLKTAGSQSLTVTDTAAGTVTGSQTGITVTPAAASNLAVAGFPSPITAGTTGAFTVTARDPYGNTATGYTGTVHFTSSDSQLGAGDLPADYTFAAADHGIKSFTAILRTAGTQSITATDTAAGSITGTQAGIVVNAPPAPQIVDNGTAGYSETGSWNTETVPSYGGTERYATSSGTGQNTATWQVAGLPSAFYQVQVSWHPFPNQAPDAPYAVFDGSILLQTVTVNQRMAASGAMFGGVPFQTLGTFKIASGTLKVVLSNTGGGTYIVADAMREAFVPVSSTDLNWSAAGDGISGPASVNVQTNFTINRTYTVSGAAAPGSFTIAYYASTSANPNQDLSKATLLGTETLTSTADLAAGNHSGASPSFQFASGGSYYLLATLTSGNFVESDGANDTNDVAVSAQAVQVLGPVIVDNGTAGYSETGTWNTESVLSYGGTERYAASSGTGQNTATWQASGVAAGLYQVQASWHPYGNQATNAPYAIYDGSTLLQTVLVNQTQMASGPSFGGVPFQTLATVNLTSGMVKVVLSNTANGTYIVADAVRIMPVPLSNTDLNWSATGDGITGPTTVNAQTPFTISRTYSVSGAAAPAKFTISYYASASSSTSQDLSQATLLGSETLSATADLAVGDHSGTSPSLQLPNGGTYYLLARLTPDSSWAESDAANDTNDVAAAPQPVQVSGPVIVDNGTAGYSETGAWATESVTSYGGTERYAAASGSGQNTAAWQVTGLPAGLYQVQVTWHAFGNESSNAPYAIYDGATLLQTVLVNQTRVPSGSSFGGVPFQTLATVNVTTGTLKVVVSNTGNGSYVVADAMRAAPVPVSNTDLNWSAPGDGILGPATVNQQTGFTIARTYTISGTAAPSSFTIAYYASMSSNPKQDLSKATFLGKETVSAAADLAGGNHTGTSPTFQFSNGGGYTLFAVLNADNSFTESDAANDTNNLAVSTQQTDVSGPVIVDNGDPTYSETGTWASQADKGAYGGSDRYTLASGNGSTTATWTVTGLAPGTYAVEASWGPYYNQSSNAPYAIYDGASLVQMVTADQTKTPSGASAGGVPFQILTHVTITSGTLTVVLSNSGNNTYVIADALRVE